MSLATSYRPQNFDEVIGQDHITGILKEKAKSQYGSTDNNKFHNNYLLFGSRGTGKTTCARILSKAINCTNLHDGNPCNECNNCVSINKQKTVDYIEIDAASHTGVDNIREEILNKVQYPPTQLKIKVYVIDEVHMLSKNAFNALLKTIEEPSSNVCFILATTEIDRVPDTIISRCQVFNFKKPSHQEIENQIKNICSKENIEYTQEAIDMIVKIAEGGFRDAIKYVDQISVLGKINEANVTQFLGVAPDSQIEDFINTIKIGTQEDVFSKIDYLQSQGVDLVYFCRQVLLYIDFNLNKDTEFLLEVSECFTEIIKTLRFHPYPAIVYKMEIYKYLKNIGVSFLSQKQISKDNRSNQYDELKAKFIEIIDKPSLKNSINEHTILEKIENGIAHIKVINKLTEIILQKDDNIYYLEQKLSEIIGVQTKIILSFEKKEDTLINSLL